MVDRLPPTRTLSSHTIINPYSHDHHSFIQRLAKPQSPNVIDIILNGPQNKRLPLTARKPPQPVDAWLGG
jgi:hypothetical protein